MKICRFWAVATACALGIAILSGCTADGDLAAKYDGGSITEDEVTAYTQQVRNRGLYTDDETWAQHLVEQGLTTKTWREQAIGTLVEDKLLAQKAEELGIEADQDRVDAQIAQDMEDAGVSSDDEQAWTDYLAATSRVTPEEYRESLEVASIRSQVLSTEVTLDDVDDVETLDEYIQNNNLVSRVVRRLSALQYNSKSDAKAALKQLKQLDGDALEEKWNELVDSDDTDQSSSDNGGDFGWDIAAGLGDVQNDLNEEKLKVGQVSGKVHEMDSVYYLIRCTDRYEFTYETTYETLPDDDLRSYILQSANYNEWSNLTASYIAALRDGAHVQVSEMPEGLPYDVDELIDQMTSSSQS